MNVEPSAVLPDSVYGELRERILSGVERPGSSITESAVALRHGVARPTAKLAIERLVTEGLLRREAHRAARVPTLERADIEDLFDTRAVVEAAAVEALAHGGSVPPEVVAAHRILLARAEHGEPFAEADIAFHRAIGSGQPSPRLAHLHALLMGEIELCIAQVQSAGLLTAGEIAFEEDQAGWRVAHASNQSTGYCPEESSWAPLARCLDALGVSHDGAFTHPVVFRRCPACGERNLVKDGDLRCAPCGGPLPAAWNFES